MRYRRARITGGTYFFAVVTHRRRAHLREAAAIDLLRYAFAYTRQRHPFTVDAMVVLPDHLHCIWTLPEGDRDFSTRWRLIKTEFSRKFSPRPDEAPNVSRIGKGERGLWQRRFWEHLIRDEEDYARHVDYIHYNPVKHGLVGAPRDWPHSSFHRHVREGFVDVNWGAVERIDFPEDFGPE